MNFVRVDIYFADAIRNQLFEGILIFVSRSHLIFTIGSNATVLEYNGCDVRQDYVFQLIVYHSVCCNFTSPLMRFFCMLLHC